LTRLYTDPAFRNSFLLDAEKALVDSELTSSEKADLIAIDRPGLLMASDSFRHKRKKRIRKSYLTRLSTFIKQRFIKVSRSKPDSY
jgi:hypothetical protein